MDPKENFLKLEEETNELLGNIKKLQEEFKSYKNATEELGAVRENLLKIINKTTELYNKSSEAIDIIKNIGGPEILNKLNDNGQQFEKFSNSIITSVKQIRLFLFITLGFSVVSFIIGIISLLT
jgi:sugar-specific transcriptional regulator TrmB